MNRRILAAKQYVKKKLTPSPERVQARQEVRKIAKNANVNYANYAPMGQARTLKSMSKYVTPERIAAGAREAERDMRSFAIQQRKEGLAIRKKKRITEGYKRASAGLLERNKRLSNWINK